MPPPTRCGFMASSRQVLMTRTLDLRPRPVSDRGGQSTGRRSQPAPWEGRRMSKRTTSAVWVKGFADMLAAEALDVRALLATAGIEPAALETPGARVQTERVSCLWELAVERSGN